jgi:hypothetical protein
MNPFTKSFKPILTVFFVSLCSLNLHAQSGNVLDFDGINDYVEIPYNINVSNNTASIQLWARVNSNTGNNQSIISSAGILGSGVRGWEIYAYPDGKWYLFVSQGAGFITVQGPSINYGVWTNIAVAYDQSAIRLYINGTLYNTVAVSNLTPNPPSLPTRIGAGNTAGTPNDFLSGQVDEVSYWSIVLSPSVISTNMQNPLTGGEPGLLAYYNFNEGVANGDNTSPAVNTLNDLSSYNMDGTLHNFALNGTSSNWISLSALPVNLVSFSGAKKDGFNLLQWSTASEQNSKNFEIQRSEDGNYFNAIGTVNAAGNSDRVLNYQYDDRSLAASPVYYYRLKMVDLDGSAKYSSIISIKNSASRLATVYPNPAIDQITINVGDKSLLNTDAVLTDLNGKVLQRILITQTSTPVNVSSYTRGMYLLKFTDGSSIKVVKE